MRQRAGTRGALQLGWGVGEGGGPGNRRVRVETTKHACQKRFNDGARRVGAGRAGFPKCPRFNQTVTDECKQRNPLPLRAAEPAAAPHRVMKAAFFTFDTTHHALWAEEVARDAGIPADVVPAPPAARARCNLALETLPEDEARLAHTLTAEGVPHGRWSPPDGLPDHAG